MMEQRQFQSVEYLFVRLVAEPLSHNDLFEHFAFRKLTRRGGSFKHARTRFGDLFGSTVQGLSERLLIRLKFSLTWKLYEAETLLWPLVKQLNEFFPCAFHYLYLRHICPSITI